MNLLKQKHYTLIFYCCNLNEHTGVKLLIGLSSQHVINGILRRSDKNKFQETCFYIVARKSYSLIYKSVLLKDLVHVHRTPFNNPSEFKERKSSIILLGNFAKSV